MRYGVKERLIGAIALLALAVIFLPFLLEEERPPAPVSDKIATPPPPAPLRVEIAEPPAPALPEPWTDQERQELQAQETPRDVGVQLALAGGVEVWAIQVASFAEAANARRLIEQLRQQGYNPYWRHVNGMAVVFIGPYIDRQQGREHQDRLLQEQGFRTLLARYVPEHEARSQGSLPSDDD